MKGNRKLKKLIKKCLQLLGYGLVRNHKSLSKDDWFDFDESCQIPFLSSIYLQIFGKEIQGFVVEVGAYDAVTYSNSSGLLDRGWKGILIEPMPALAEKCRHKYVNNSGVKVIQKAISNLQGIQTLEIAGPLSTLSKKLFNEYQTLDWAKPSLTQNSIEVETLTLDELLRDEGVDSNFELLIVDVEGFEEQVFQGFNLVTWKPKMIIIELSDFHPNLNSHRREHYLLGNKILNHGYTIIYKDGINSVYIKSEFLKQIFEV